MPRSSPLFTVVAFLIVPLSQKGQQSIIGRSKQSSMKLSWKSVVADEVPSCSLKDASIKDDDDFCDEICEFNRCALA